MDRLRDMVMMRHSGEFKPDLERFLRAVTAHELEPVPIGDFCADVERRKC